MTYVYSKLPDYWEHSWCVIGLDRAGNGVSHSFMDLKEFSAFYRHAQNHGNSPMLIDEDLHIHFEPTEPYDC